MDRAAFLGNLLRDFVSHLTLRVQDKDIIFCAQGDLHQFLFCTHALAALREQLARTLPAYLLPRRCVSLAAMPFTPAGKPDLRALKEFL